MDLSWRQRLVTLTLSLKQRYDAGAHPFPLGQRQRWYLEIDNFVARRLWGGNVVAYLLLTSESADDQ